MQTALSIAIEGESVREEAQESARASLNALIERHSRLVYRIALAVTRRPDEAEDVAQETFLQLWRGGRLEEIEDERGYLARVAWRLAIRRKKPRAAEQELPELLYSRAANPEELAMDAQLETWLHGAIDRLPEKLRQPLALAALGDLKLVEVARVLGLPEGTVRRRIHTARQKLKVQLADRKEGRA